MQRDIADLVKKQCSSVSLLELSHMIGVCICKRTLHMAEQLAFEKGFGQRTGINADKGLQ